MTFSQLRHAGFLVDDVQQTADFYTSVFGFGPFRIWTVNFTDVRLRGGEPGSFTTRIALARIGEAELELVESRPSAGRSLYFEEAKQKRSGCMHHLALTVANLDEAIAGFGATGVQVLMRGSFPGGRFAYLDSERQAGIIYEIMEMTPRQPSAAKGS